MIVITSVVKNESDFFDLGQIVFRWDMENAKIERLLETDTSYTAQFDI